MSTLGSTYYLKIDFNSIKVPRYRVEIAIHLKMLHYCLFLISKSRLYYHRLLHKIISYSAQQKIWNIPMTFFCSFWAAFFFLFINHFRILLLFPHIFFKSFYYTLIFSTYPTQLLLQLTHHLRLFNLTNFTFFIPFDLLSFFKLLFDFSFKLSFVLLETHRQRLSHPLYSFLYLLSTVFIFPEFNQSFSISDVCLDIRVIKLDCPQTVLILSLKFPLYFHAFRSIEEESRIILVYFLY